MSDKEFDADLAASILSGEYRELMELVENLRRAAELFGHQDVSGDDLVARAVKIAEQEKERRERDDDE